MRGDSTRGGEGTLGGVGDLVGAATFGGLGTLRGDIMRGGDAPFSGLATFGGEYVRGEPSVCGDLSPLGEAMEGKGIEERRFVTVGVPATCSGSPLKSRIPGGGMLGIELADDMEGQLRLKPTP